MEKEKLPPIPTPVSQRWREFKIQVIPTVVFLCVVTCIVYLWTNHVQPLSVIGSVETNWVNVTCLQDGVLSEMAVERFQNVTEGQEIGIIIKTDPELIKATIASVQADLEVQRERLRVDQRRTDQGYQDIKQKLQTYLLEQVIEKANLTLYSNDWVRAKRLFEEGGPQKGLISEANLDQARAKYETTRASIEQREELIAEYRKMVNELAPKGA